MNVTTLRQARVTQVDLTGYKSLIIPKFGQLGPLLIYKKRGIDQQQTLIIHFGGSDIIGHLLMLSKCSTLA